MSISSNTSFFLSFSFSNFFSVVGNHPLFVIGNHPLFVIGNYPLFVVGNHPPFVIGRLSLPPDTLPLGGVHSGGVVLEWCPSGVHLATVIAAMATTVANAVFSGVWL